MFVQLTGASRTGTIKAMKRIIAAAAGLFLALPAGAADGMISDINWYQIDAYCALQRADARFDYNDPATWTFVYFSQLDGREEPGTSFVSINQQLRQLEPIETVQGKDGETRRFRTFGADAYEVTLTIHLVASGEEDFDYAGFLSIEGSGGSETINVQGGCGV